MKSIRDATSKARFSLAVKSSLKFKENQTKTAEKTSEEKIALKKEVFTLLQISPSLLLKILMK